MKVLSVQNISNYPQLHRNLFKKERFKSGNCIALRYKHYLQMVLPVFNFFFIYGNKIYGSKNWEVNFFCRKKHNYLYNIFQEIWDLLKIFEFP